MAWREMLARHGRLSLVIVNEIVQQQGAEWTIADARPRAGGRRQHAPALASEGESFSGATERRARKASGLG